MSRSNIRSLPNSTQLTSAIPGCEAAAPFRFFLFPLLGDCLDGFLTPRSGESPSDGLLATPSSPSAGSPLPSAEGVDSPLLLLVENLPSNPISLLSCSSSVFVSLSLSFSDSPSEFSLSLARRSWQRFLFRVLRWFFLRWPSMLELVLKFSKQCRL